MGKYEQYNPQDDDRDTYKNFILCCIANELAESNRLIYLQIKAQLGPNPSLITEIVKQLEDQS